MILIHENGYFVLNDMFRYIDEATRVRDPHAAQDIPEDFVQEKYVQENHEDAPAPGIVHEAPVDVQKVGGSEVPKRSYASIVMVMKENAAPMSAARSPTKVVEPKRQESQATHVPLPTPFMLRSLFLDFRNSSRSSIYLKGLPLDATPALLNVFQKFGVIRTNGIQVRSQKGFCFGFVEFESTCSMQSALEASPIILRNHRGRSAFGVGTGYRNEGGRGRGSFGGGRGRNDFNGYGGNRGNNNRGGYANRANNDGGGFPRRGRRGSGGGIDANGATKPVDAPRVKEESGVDINLWNYRGQDQTQITVGGEGQRKRGRTPAEKETKRLKRNRVPAQQARERKKAYLGELENRVKDLENRNSVLDERLSTLQNENQDHANVTDGEVNESTIVHLRNPRSFFGKIKGSWTVAKFAEKPRRLLNSFDRQDY
ncbi:hypothetical protein Bca101_055053 [Brassica carinata]